MRIPVCAMLRNEMESIGILFAGEEVLRGERGAFHCFTFLLSGAEVLSLVCFWGFVLFVWLFVGFLCVLFLVLFLLTPEGLATSLGLAPLVVMR